MARVRTFDSTLLGFFAQAALAAFALWVTPATAGSAGLEAMIDIHRLSSSPGHGSAGLPEDMIDITFTGSAGQSFGAFVAPGVTHATDWRRKRLSRQGPIRRPDRRVPAADV